MVGGQHKEEFPSLLPQGFHTLSRAELKRRCVGDFPISEVRPHIMAGLEVVLERIEAVGIAGTIWLDGSFSTSKQEPDDVDFVLIAAASYRPEGTQDQKDCVERLINRENDPKASFRCDTDVVLDFPPESPFHQLTEETKAHFPELYGFSVTAREPKGIVVLTVPEDAVEAGQAGEEVRK